MEHVSLPSEFLTFEDILMDNTFNKQTNTTNSIFPSEFPYEFNHNANITTSLNRSLQPIASHKNYEMSSMMGYGRDSWDLIYQAAAEIAELKMNAVDVLLSNNRKLLHQHQEPPRNFSSFYNAFVDRVREEQMLKHKQQIWSNNHAQTKVIGSGIGVHGEHEQVAWQYMRQQNQENRTIGQGALINGGSRNQFSGGVKKQSSGTGVFLPRSYGATNHNNSNKSSCLATPILDRGTPRPDRNFNVIGSGIVQPRGQTRFVEAFDSNYVSEDEAVAENATYAARKFSTARELPTGTLIVSWRN